MVRDCLRWKARYLATSILSFDRAASIRRVRPQRDVKQLKRRVDTQLPFVNSSSRSGRELILDTSVYVNVLQAKLPSEIRQILGTRVINHSTVACSELAYLFGALDPGHLDTTKVLVKLSQTLDGIPPHRLTTPSPRACLEAGMLAGLTARLTAQLRTMALLNDALLFLQAAELGYDLLTANIREFDWFDQLLPGSGLLLYRQLD